MYQRIVVEVLGNVTIAFGSLEAHIENDAHGIRKGHNSEDACIEAVRVAREAYGLKPEILMVFGGTAEHERSLQLAVQFSADMVERYGAVPRPHVSKLPSGISHPNTELRQLVATYYLELTQISGSTTEPIYPLSPEFDETTQAPHRQRNTGTYDR